MYQDMGGGYLYAIAIEKNTPGYPGMALEEPVSTRVDTPKGQLNYYRSTRMFSRANGRFYYFNTIGRMRDIDGQSLITFNELLNNIVIE